MDWRQVGLLYRREIRAALREKSIVINSILIPAFLYPFLLWAVLNGILFATGQGEKARARVIFQSWPESHPKLRQSLQHDQRIEALEFNRPLAEVELAIQRGTVDALVEFLAPTNSGAALPGNFAVRVTYNQARERSSAARERVVEQIRNYRDGWITRAARKLGLEAAVWQGFTLAHRNVASNRQMGTFVLGLVAPLIFVVMVAVGTFYPAVDAIAGERERNTWETLMSCAASRVSVVTAKYLYAVTMGGLAGVLNLAVVLLTLKPVFGPLLAQAGRNIDCAVPLAALPVALVAAILLAGFIAAGMMLLAVFARTFKEGQAMAAPFYMLVLLPVMFLQAPEIKFTPALACLPVVNVTLALREALAGKFHWPELAISLAVSLALIAVCIRAAAGVLQIEEILVGSYGGGPGKFLREHLFKPRGKTL